MKALVLSALLGLSLWTVPGSAANFSYSGTFASDSDVAFFNFTLAAPTPGVQFYTTSYAGTGGFQPILSLFLADGTGMNPAQVGPCAGPLVLDVPTGICGDVYYPTTLSFPGGVWAAGTYIVALTQNGNGALGNLGDGFFVPDVLGLTSGSNYTCQEGAPGYQGTPGIFPTSDPFCDPLNPIQRNGTWALTIEGVDSSSLGQTPSETPEPSTWAITAIGLVSVAARRFRKG